MRRVSRLRKAATIGENRGMKVLCVDDHPTVREGVAFLIAQEFPDLALVHAGSLAEAEQSMLADPDIRLVLLDLGLPDADGLKAVNQLRTKCPDATIVVLSAETMPDIIVAAIDCGASGFIPKTANAKEMLAALRRVLDGDIYLPPAVLNARAQHAIPREVLTPRQLDVLALLVQGKPNKLICRQLGLSESTVKTHLATIFQKLGVNSRTQAMLAAARAGLRLPRL
jgi:DNA-binding NarL/FixJ family response regulator